MSSRDRSALRAGYVIRLDVGATLAALRVFLVERQAIMREGLRAVLASAPGVVVVGEATDANAGAAMVRDLQPDVVLVDLTDSNGLNLVRTIRRRRGPVRVIALASHAEAGEIWQALRAGAHGVLLKGTSGEALIEAVRVVQVGGTLISREASMILVSDYVRQRSGRTMAGPLTRLSKRERQVLDLVVEGMTSVQIGERLAISPKSVDTYRSRLMSKVGVQNVTGLVKFAMDNGLV